MQKENKNRLAKILLGIFSLFLSFEIHLIGFFLFENYFNIFQSSPQNIELKNASSPLLSSSMPATGLNLISKLVSEGKLFVSGNKIYGVNSGATDKIVKTLNQAAPNGVKYEQGKTLKNLQNLETSKSVSGTNTVDVSGIKMPELNSSQVNAIVREDSAIKTLSQVENKIEHEKNVVDLVRQSDALYEGMTGTKPINTGHTTQEILGDAINNGGEVHVLDENLKRTGENLNFSQEAGEALRESYRKPGNFSTLNPVSPNDRYTPFGDRIGKVYMDELPESMQNKASSSFKVLTDKDSGRQYIEWDSFRHNGETPPGRVLEVVGSDGKSSLVMDPAYTQAYRDTWATVTDGYFTVGKIDKFWWENEASSKFLKDYDLVNPKSQFEINKEVMNSVLNNPVDGRGNKIDVGARINELLDPRHSDKVHPAMRDRLEQLKNDPEISKRLDDLSKEIKSNSPTQPTVTSPAPVTSSSAAIAGLAGTEEYEIDESQSKLQQFTQDGKNFNFDPESGRVTETDANGQTKEIYKEWGVKGENYSSEAAQAINSARGQDAQTSLNVPETQQPVKLSWWEENMPTWLGGTTPEEKSLNQNFPLSTKEINDKQNQSLQQEIKDYQNSLIDTVPPEHREFFKDYMQNNPGQPVTAPERPTNYVENFLASKGIDSPELAAAIKKYDAANDTSLKLSSNSFLDSFKPETTGAKIITGMNFVPGVGPIAGTLAEPIITKIFDSTGNENIKEHRAANSLEFQQLNHTNNELENLKTQLVAHEIGKTPLSDDDLSTLKNRIVTAQQEQANLINEMRDKPIGNGGYQGDWDALNKELEEYSTTETDSKDSPWPVAPAGSGAGTSSQTTQGDDWPYINEEIENSQSDNPLAKINNITSNWENKPDAFNPNEWGDLVNRENSKGTLASPSSTGSETYQGPWNTPAGAGSKPAYVNENGDLVIPGGNKTLKNYGSGIFGKDALISKGLDGDVIIPKGSFTEDGNFYEVNKGNLLIPIGKGAENAMVAKGGLDIPPQKEPYEYTEDDWNSFETSSPNIHSKEEAEKINKKTQEDPGEGDLPDATPENDNINANDNSNNKNANDNSSKEKKDNKEKDNDNTT